MSGIAKINPKKLQKTCILFGLDDVLVPGSVSGPFDQKPVHEILKNLSLLEKKLPDFHFVLMTGYTQNKCETRIENAKLARFFAPEKIFCVTDSYIESKTEVDRNLHREQLKKDPEFKDEFFKQRMIDHISEKYAVPKSKMVYVGNDLWFSGFYTRRFSQIDFALIRDSLSVRGVPAPEPVPGLTYISRTWADIQKLLLGKFSPPDYRHLDSWVQKTLEKELFGGKLAGQILDAKRKAAEREKK